MKKSTQQTSKVLLSDFSDTQFFNVFKAAFETPSESPSPKRQESLKTIKYQKSNFSLHSVADELPQSEITKSVLNILQPAPKIEQLQNMNEKSTVDL